MDRLQMVMVLAPLVSQAIKAGHKVGLEFTWIGVNVWHHYDNTDMPCDYMPIYESTEARKAETFMAAVDLLNGLIANPIEVVEEVE
jgi:hypothetical protein